MSRLAHNHRVASATPTNSCIRLSVDLQRIMARDSGRKSKVDEEVEEEVEDQEEEQEGEEDGEYEIEAIVQYKSDAFKDVRVRYFPPCHL